MAFTAGTIYVCIIGHYVGTSFFAEGDEILGSKLTTAGSPEGYWVVKGSLPSEITAAKRAAGLPY